MAGLGTTEIIIIALVIVLLFGARKLPEMAKGVGSALRIFKKETKGLRGDDDVETTPPPPPAALPKAQPIQPAPQVAPPLEQDARRDSA